MNEDEIIIKDYREVFRKYAKDGVIDLDSRLKHKFNFQVHRLESYVREMQGLIPPNRQSQFYIILVKKGAGEKTIGHFSFPLHKNMLMVIPKRVTHSSKYWSLDCCGYFTSFNIEFFLQNVFPKQHIVNKKIFKLSIRPFLILSADQEKKLETIFEFLLEENKGQEIGKNEMLAIKVLELIVQCDRFFTEAEVIHHEPVYNEVIERFNTLIQKHYTTEKSVGFYARSLNMHPNHLNALVKKYTGLTAKQTITDFILTEAKCLLHSSSSSIKEVAYTLGFNHPDQFSSFFRKQSSLSPREYKLNPV